MQPFKPIHPNAVLVLRHRHCERCFVFIFDISFADTPASVTKLRRRYSPFALPKRRGLPQDYSNLRALEGTHLRHLHQGVWL